MNPEYSIRVFRSVLELESLRDFWQVVVRHPNTDFDLFATVIRSRPEIKEPAVFVLYHFESPKAILIGRIEEASMEIKFGYFRLPSPQLRNLILIYDGACGELTEVAVELFVLEIKTLLKRKTIDAVVLNNLPWGSKLSTAIRNRIPFLCRDHVLLPNPHWSARLPKTLDEFISRIGKKHRYRFRRQAKILETAYLNAVEVIRFTEENEVPRLSEDAEKVACKTYQRSLGIEAMNSHEMIDRLSVHARSAALKGYILYIKKEPCAFCIGTLYKGVFYLDFMGYDTRYHAFAPGTYLFLKLIDDLCKNTQASIVDFGFGDALYKQMFGDTTWQEATVMLFPATAKGILLNMIRQSIALLTRCLTRIFSNRFLQTLKTRWRKRKAGKLIEPPLQETT